MAMLSITPAKLISAKLKTTLKRRLDTYQTRFCVKKIRLFPKSVVLSVYNYFMVSCF